MLYTALHERDIPSIYSEDTAKAQRGSIVSADGYYIATTQKLYKAVVNTRNIDPDKEELFIQLFSIYSGTDPDEIRQRLHTRKGSVTLSYHISPKEAMYLKTLAFELRRLGVFIEYETPGGDRILQGLSILESGEARRYPYGRLLTPLLGYPRKIEEEGYTRVYGIKGLEKFFDEELNPQQNKTQKALRDVNGYLILNRQSDVKRQIKRPYRPKLNIPSHSEARWKRSTTRSKSSCKYRQIIATVMRPKTGKIIALAVPAVSTPAASATKDYPSLNTNAIEYSYEPGSVIKPIIFALLLGPTSSTPTTWSTATAEMEIRTQVIVDEHKFDMITPKTCRVPLFQHRYRQLAQKLGGVEYTEGLQKFGFTRFSGVDLPTKARKHPRPRSSTTISTRRSPRTGTGCGPMRCRFSKPTTFSTTEAKPSQPDGRRSALRRQRRAIPMQIQSPTQGDQPPPRPSG